MCRARCSRKWFHRPGEGPVCTPYQTEWLGYSQPHQVCWPPVRQFTASDSTAGGMKERRGAASTVMYKRLASLLADKHAQSYPTTMSWIRCLLNFSLLRSAIICIRGARSTSNRACHTAVLSECQLDLMASEGRIPVNSDMDTRYQHHTTLHF